MFCKLIEYGRLATHACCHSDSRGFAPGYVVHGPWPKKLQVLCPHKDCVVYGLWPWVCSPTAIINPSTRRLSFARYSCQPRDVRPFFRRRALPMESTLRSQRLRVSIPSLHHCGHFANASDSTMGNRSRVGRKMMSAPLFYAPIFIPDLAMNTSVNEHKLACKTSP